MGETGRRCRGVRFAVILAATAVLVGGCGARPLSELNASESGQGQRGPQQAPPQDKAAAAINAVQPDPSLNKLLPGRIRSSGLRMSTSQGYPPMEMFASDGKTIIGLDPSLARALARKLGVVISVSNEDFNAQIPGLVTGRYDVVMTSMSDTAERQKKVTFVDYVQAGAALSVRKGNPKQIQTPADLCGKTVAVVDNGSSLALTNGYDKACKDAGNPAIKILKFTDDQDGMLALAAGRADVNLTDYVVAADRAQDAKNNSEAIAIAGTEAPWGIAMNPNEKQLITAVQRALQSLVNSGEYGKILAAWGLQPLAVKSVTVNAGK